MNEDDAMKSRGLIRPRLRAKSFASFFSVQSERLQNRLVVH